MFISDNQGVMLSMSTPQEGQHHDLYQIKELFDELCELLKEAGIAHANAWIDGFKALLVRFEFSIKNWMALHFMAFFCIFLRKLVNNKKL